MSTISSYLNSSAISSEISTVEKRLEAPITSLGSQVSSDKALISAWGSISGAVSSLSNALSGIENLSTIDSRAITSSNSNAATATVGNSALAGTYSLTGISLATGQELYSGLVSNTGGTLSGGAGAMTIALKSGKSETISLGSGSTLNDLATAINKQAGGVKASVVGTSEGSRLVLNSSGVGSAAAFSVTGTGALKMFSYSSATNKASSGEVRAQTASNATLTLNGIPITSATNTLSSAVAGATISLTGAGSTTLSVSSAPTALSGNLGSVVSSLNSAISAISSETKFVSKKSGSSTTSSAGPLLGNFTASNLKNELMSAVSSLAGSGISASQLGLSLSSSGKVSFSSASFASTYAKNPTEVGSLVSQLYTKLKNITASAIGAASGSSTTGSKVTGYISAQTNSLNDSINSIQQQITQISKQASATLKSLSTAYTAAENKESSASITSAYLSIFLGNSSSS